MSRHWRYEIQINMNTQVVGLTECHRKYDGSVDLIFGKTQRQKEDALQAESNP